MIDSASGYSRYGPQADLWSLGCVVYVMLGGAYPFDSRLGPIDVLIKNAKFHFRYPRFQKVSENAKNLIRGLLTVDPKRRLTLPEVFQHPWVQSYQVPSGIAPLPILVPPESLEFQHDLTISARSILEPCAGITKQPTGPDRPYPLGLSRVVSVTNLENPPTVEAVPETSCTTPQGVSNETAARSLVVKVQSPCSKTQKPFFVEASCDPPSQIRRVSVNAPNIVPSAIVQSAMTVRPCDSPVVASSSGSSSSSSSANNAPSLPVSSETPSSASHQAIVLVSQANCRPFAHALPSTASDCGGANVMTPPQASTAGSFSSSFNTSQRVSPSTASYFDTSAMGTSAVPFNRKSQLAPVHLPMISTHPHQASASEYVRELPFERNTANTQAVARRQPAGNMLMYTDASLATLRGGPEAMLSSNLFCTTGRTRLPPAPPTFHAPLDMPQRREEVVKTTETIFNFDELLYLQISIMRRVHWIYIVLRHSPQAAKRLKECITEEHNIQMHSAQIVQQFETTCCSVLGLFPDLSLAIAEHQLDLAMLLLEDMRTWIVDIKTNIQFHQQRIHAFSRHVSELLDAIRAVKTATDQQLAAAAGHFAEDPSRQSGLATSATATPATTAMVAPSQHQIPQQGNIPHSSFNGYLVEPRQLSESMGSSIDVIDPTVYSVMSDDPLRQRTGCVTEVNSLHDSHRATGDGGSSGFPSLSVASNGGMSHDEATHQDAISSSSLLPNGAPVSGERRDHSSSFPHSSTAFSVPPANDPVLHSVVASTPTSQSIPLCQTERSVTAQSHWSRLSGECCSALSTARTATSDAGDTAGAAVRSDTLPALLPYPVHSDVPHDVDVAPGTSLIATPVSSIHHDGAPEDAPLQGDRSSGLTDGDRGVGDTATTPLSRISVDSSVLSDSPLDHLTTEMPYKANPTNVGGGPGFQTWYTGVQTAVFQQLESLVNNTIHRMTDDTCPLASGDPQEPHDQWNSRSGSAGPDVREQPLNPHASDMPRRSSAHHRTTHAAGIDECLAASQASPYVIGEDASNIARELLDLLFVASNPSYPPPSAATQQQRTTAHLYPTTEAAPCTTGTDPLMFSKSSPADRHATGSSYIVTPSTPTSSHSSQSPPQQQQTRQSGSPRTPHQTSGPEKMPTDYERRRHQDTWLMTDIGSVTDTHTFYRQRFYYQAIRMSDLLIFALDEVRQLDQTLRQSSSFWMNLISVIDRLCQMKTHTERLLQYSTASPRLAERLAERLGDYQTFWKALRDQSHHYVVQAKRKMAAMQDFSTALESTADRVDTAMALRWGESTALLCLENA